MPFPRLFSSPIGPILYGNLGDIQLIFCTLVGDCALNVAIWPIVDCFFLIEKFSSGPHPLNIDRRETYQSFALRNLLKMPSCTP